MIRLIDSGISTAQGNMDQDRDLLEQLDPSSEPILHFYDWQRPSATYGYFAAPSEHLYLDQAKSLNLDLGRRPTGGGIVFHIWDFAFSFLMPSEHPAFSLNTLDNYRFVNEAVLNAVCKTFDVDQPLIIHEEFPSLSPECVNFCMAKPTQFDVVYLGKKIAGAAQRRRKQGYLHQGTISLAAPSLDLLQTVLKSQTVIDAMARFTFAPLGDAPSPLEWKEAKEKIGFALHNELSMKINSSLHV